MINDLKYKKVERERELVGPNEIRIMSNGNLMKYVEYAKGLFTTGEAKEVEIKATGNAISKAVSLAEILKRTFKGLHQKTSCGSTTIKDHYEPTEEGLEPKSRERVVSFIEITLSKNPLDKNHPGYQPPMADSVVDEFDLDKAKISVGYAVRRGGRGGLRGAPRGGFRGAPRGAYRGGRGGAVATSAVEVEATIVEPVVVEDHGDTRGRGRGRGRGAGRGARGARGGNGSFRGGMRGRGVNRGVAPQ